MEKLWEVRNVSIVLVVAQNSNSYLSLIASSSACRLAFRPRFRSLTESRAGPGDEARNRLYPDDVCMSDSILSDIQMSSGIGTT